MTPFWIFRSSFELFKLYFVKKTFHQSIGLYFLRQFSPNSYLYIPNFFWYCSIIVIIKGIVCLLFESLGHLLNHLNCFLHKKQYQRCKLDFKLRNSPENHLYISNYSCYNMARVALFWIFRSSFKPLKLFFMKKYNIKGVN